MDGERASLMMPGTTLLASLVAGTTYAVYRAHQLAERWKPRGVWLLPVLFVVATSISYVADGGTLTQPPLHKAPAGGALAPQQASPPPTAPPVTTKGLPDYALPRQGLDITYDFGPPGSPHPVPGPATATAATFPVASRAATPPASASHPAPPSPARPAPPPRRTIPSPPPLPPSPLPPLPPLPRPPIPRIPVPALR